MRTTMAIISMLLLHSASYAATSGTEQPTSVPPVVAEMAEHCKAHFARYQERPEPKAFAQSPDGNWCGFTGNSKRIMDSAQPNLNFDWQAMHATAISECSTPGKDARPGATPPGGCFVVMTNNKAWTKWVPKNEWRAQAAAARPTATPTSFSNGDEGAGGRYMGKVSTRNTATNEPWERPISFSIGANAFTGQPDNAPNVKIEGGILPGGKVQGTLYGGKTNYAIEGQVTKMANGQRLFRATLRPLEPNVTITGTIEAVAEAEGASNTTAPSNLYVIPPKQ